MCTREGQKGRNTDVAGTPMNLGHVPRITCPTADFKGSSVSIVLESGCSFLFGVNYYLVTGQIYEKKKMTVD